MNLYANRRKQTPPEKRMDFHNTPLATIAQEIPGATAIFNHYQLSFCCGGKHTLKEAVHKANLSLDEVTAELDKLHLTANEAADWQNASDQELINHLLDRYHQVHRKQLAELYRLAERVETVHGDHPHCPLGLASHIKLMAHALEDHMQKEEQILFPILANGQGQMATGPIRVMRQDHEHHGEDVAKIDELTNNITVPTGACNTWQALYLGLNSFKADLLKHIELENNILFARHTDA